MKIIFIGSGNVATHMSMAMKKAGHVITQVYSRNIDNADALATILSCEATDNVDNVSRNADVYVFSVKDDALEGLIEKICPMVPDAICLHTAGSMPMDVFKGKAQHYGVLYPMQTFSRSRAVNFGEVPCFIEASDNDTQNSIAKLAQSITESVRVLSSEKRKSLHLAAVFACNFTNHCYHLAERVLEEAGIDFSLYLPLIDETARKVHELSPKAAQTGPAVRYDENVINRHIAMLTDERMKEIYRIMSEDIYSVHSS